MTDDTGNPKRPGRDATMRPLPRRFFQEAAAAPRGNAFAVVLDGRVARTPRRHELSVADEALARDLAAEWAAQGDHIDPATMPLTTLVCTAIDAVRGREAAVAEEIVRYAGSDLTCYRAEAPEALRVLQAAKWDPALDWMSREFGARFNIASGITHVAQPAEATAAVGDALAGLPALQLAATHVLTTLTGSAILALAVLKGHMSLDDAWSAAHVDDDWQIDKWGEDAEATERRRRRHLEARAAARILAVDPTAGH
jgi:chaperone required for assembly of F1-ATPase